MSKVNQNLIRINLNSGKYDAACKLALIENMEAGNMVYLPNAYALVESKVNPHQWAGYLSSMEKQGFYIPYGDSHFGMVDISKR